MDHVQRRQPSRILLAKNRENFYRINVAHQNIIFLSEILTKTMLGNIFSNFDEYFCCCQYNFYIVQPIIEKNSRILHAVQLLDDNFFGINVAHQNRNFLVKSEDF
jgi:hypothetical protein